MNLAFEIEYIQHGGQCRYVDGLSNPQVTLRSNPNEPASVRSISHVGHEEIEEEVEAEDTSASRPRRKETLPPRSTTSSFPRVSMLSASSGSIARGRGGSRRDQGQGEELPDICSLSQIAFGFKSIYRRFLGPWSGIEIKLLTNRLGVLENESTACDPSRARPSEQPGAPNAEEDT